MQKFTKNNIQELRNLLYNSCIHDAKLEKVEYKYGEDSIKFEIFNPISMIKIDIIFHNIRIAFATKGEWEGTRETIISLTAEEDFSYLQTYFPKCNECTDDTLYLLFQMFSGDELHIVAKEVFLRNTE